MDLRKRLSQLDRLTRRADAEAPDRKTVDPELQRQTLLDLGLTEERTASGTIWSRRMLDSVSPPEVLPSFAGFFTHADAAHPGCGDLLFLDTETTGLAGGTGTLAFLVGVSWWTEEGLVTRQYFLASPGQEPALLRALADLGRSFSVVLTFNGASFDLPLLRTRALMNRTTDPMESLVSWDLLVPARRLWGRMLDNCRQQTLEAAVCDLPPRIGDIDGSRIPSEWFDFLSCGEPGQLGNVLHHNHLDMLGMAHLLREVASRALLVDRQTKPEAADGDWRECWSLARICEREKDTGSAIRFLSEALQLVMKEGPGADPRFLPDAIRIMKRSGDWQLVEELIIWGLTHEEQEQEWLHREAAILYERRLGRLDKALAHALLCSENRRVERLQHKLAR